MVEIARLIMEAGFPDSLLLNQNHENENVLDMSIRKSKLFASRGHWRHIIRYLLEEKQDSFLGPNDADEKKVKKYRRYLRKREADVSTSDLHQQDKLLD